MRLGWRTLETVAWFGFYALAALFLLTYDGASPIYSDIVIKNRTTDWLPGATRDYTPATTIRGSDASPYFVNGWWWADGGGRWGKATRSTMELIPTTDLPAGSRISGRLGVLVGAKRVPASVAIEVDGVALGQLNFMMAGEAQAFDLPLPAAVKRGAKLEIAFVLGEPASTPLLIGLADDARTRGVRFYSLTVAPP